LSGKGLAFEQTAELSHAENNTIAVSYTLRDIANLTLNFDAVKLKVEAEQTRTWNDLTSGSSIQENTQLRLTAIGLSADTPIQAWKIGNTIVPAKGHELTYTVRKADAEDGVITISYAPKTAKKFTLKFEGAKMTVTIQQQHGSWKKLSSDAQVEEGTQIRIVADNLPAGHLVDTWTIRKRTEEANGNSTWFRVGSDYTEGNAINISYTTKNK